MISSLVMSASQSTSSSLPLLRTIKSTSIEAASIGETETRLTVGAAPGSSSFCEEGTSIDVLAGGAFSTTEASRTPRDNDTSNEDDDDEDPPLDDTTKTADLGERASNERDTLWTQHFWINFFFTILVVARLKR
jgi:hypothetical protein